MKTAITEQHLPKLLLLVSQPLRSDHETKSVGLGAFFAQIYIISAQISRTQEHPYNIGTTLVEALVIVLRYA